VKVPVFTFVAVTTCGTVTRMLNFRLESASAVAASEPGVMLHVQSGINLHVKLKERVYTYVRGQKTVCGADTHRGGTSSQAHTFSAL
jgi:hypothetical protein